ncbi:MAG TPA: lipid kinase [Gemmatimonadales bacterium]|nr:lipid kinase [Gemmatimonadales bacterium]
MTGTRALLLVNPKARRGRDTGPDAVERLRQLGLTLEVVEILEPAGLPDLVRGRADRVDRVLVAGGDGTLNLVLQGLAGTDTPLGIIPVGTANNTARTLGLPTELPQACAAAAGSSTRRIDLGRVNDRWFFTTASLGISVAVTRLLTRSLKRRWGKLAYAYAALRAGLERRPFDAEITSPSQTLRLRAVQIVVGNGRYYGSALPVAEDAEIDDGWLDLYAVEARSRWRLVTLAPALKRGTHGERPDVHTLRTRSVEIRTPVPKTINVDGELGPQTPATFVVVPRALAVLCP